MELSKRKSNRLKEYDYSKSGAYFVTICTKDKKQILSKVVGNNVGEGRCALPENQLTLIGMEIDKCIDYIAKKYSNINIEKYVIMPNHIHIIVTIKEMGGHGNPPLHKIIGELKSYTTYKFGTQFFNVLFMIILFATTMIINKYGNT